MSAALSRPNRAGDGLDRLFALAIVVCIAATVLVLVPGIHGHVVLPTVDLVMDTVALVACAALTALAWARFRERRVIAAVYHAAAFLALAVAYGIAVLVSLHHSASIGSLAEPENAQVLVFAVARLAAAVLFVLAGVFTGRRTLRVESRLDPGRTDVRRAPCRARRPVGQPAARRAADHQVHRCDRACRAPPCSGPPSTS